MTGRPRRFRRAVISLLTIKTLCFNHLAMGGRKKKSPTAKAKTGVAKPVSEHTEAAQGQPLNLTARGMTDIGRKRPHNEDSIEISEPLGLFAVADGMGGHAA